MRFTIEPAEREDIDALLPLLQQLFALEADFSFDADAARHALDRLLDEPGRCRVMLARNGDAVVGMCSAQLVISTSEGAHSAWVEDVVVSPEAQGQGQGVGRALLEALWSWCREQGATRMQLVADRENRPALDFYRHIGWEPTQLEVWRKR
jgi:ribosomal protein S18 acetylase RimI-like enzyme